MSLLDGLNPEQHDAVTTTEGPVLVLAGAGTGKTRVITVRLAHLIANGVPPESILAVTFTNKAAREMRERVASLVGKDTASKPFVGTFHSFCMEALRTHGALLDLPRFTISDGGDQIAILRSILREVSVGEASLQPSALLSRISLLKNKLANNEEFLKGAKDDEDELVGRAWGRYDEKLRTTRTLDFDDLLLYTVRLLAVPEMRALFQERFRYVMVDEYQDTNGPQYEIIRAIAEGHRNLCVVGDDDQSIYGWRGADVKKILGFERDFTGAKVVRLERNYRSTEQIIDAANRVIRNNPNRHEKTLRSAVGAGPPLQGVIAEDEVEEADHVAVEIQNLVRREVARLGDFAVLFRTGPQARVLEGQFRTRGIPYVLVGGMSFFDRKEIRDVLAYLKLVVNADDETALLRVVNAPPRGIGKASIEKLLRHAGELGSIPKALESAPEIPGIPAAAGQAAQALGRSLGTMRGRKDIPLPRLIEEVLEVVDYDREIERSYPDELTRTQRRGAIDDIVQFAQNHADRRKIATLATFLHDLSLSADDDATAEDASKRDVVTLMTLHAAKGLEYPRVYLVGMEEGLLPHTRAIAEDTVEEERRLAYVGITRAKDYLTLSLTRNRMRFGHKIESQPSRFFYELKGETPPDFATPDLPGGSGKGKRKKASAKKKAAKRKGRRASR